VAFEGCTCACSHVVVSFFRGVHFMSCIIFFEGSEGMPIFFWEGFVAPAQEG
jgi:hypothetical protein